MCIQILSIWLQLQLKSSRLGSSSHRDRKKWTGGKQRPDCAHQFVGVLRCDVRVVGPRCETILVHEARCILIEFLQELFGSFLDCLSPGRRSRKQNQDAQNRHLPGALTASQQITVLSRVHSTPFELSYKTKHAHIIHCLCISTYRHFKYHFIFLIQPSEELSILTIKSTCTCVCLVSALRCGEFRVRVLKSHEHETCLFYLKGNIVFVKFAVWKYVSDN